MSETELKPCPFCGCHVQYEEDWDVITCAHAKDGCGFTYNCDLDLTAATKQWNTRATERESDALRRELEEEQGAHETIAAICFAHGADAGDGTSISAVRSIVAQLAAAQKEIEGLKRQSKEALDYWKSYYEEEIDECELKAAACKGEGDMHGWNLFQGKLSGLVNHDIALTKFKNIHSAIAQAKAHV